MPHEAEKTGKIAGPDGQTTFLPNPYPCPPVCFCDTCAPRQSLPSEVLALCEAIERRPDYPECRTRVPGLEMVSNWLDGIGPEDIPQLRRWADGTDPLPERRIGVFRERLLPLPQGVCVG